ncbi:nuclease harbi1 [Plakobranchus ocellatus]|uniref:Nuclease harbi1 n=1 Tax=Plakobranchus ocellatus TaxID=259542 RepID=A0AAV4AZL6_9GAST|nr:nuclease harbi1 [Plakobranchus ocellatus]
MSFPKSAVEWEEKAVSYQQRWDYPHCVGAIDGKHVVIEAPANSGSLYYNYKHSFSIMPLAMVDADYKFVYVDIGAYGKQPDGGIFAVSSLGRALTPPNSLKISTRCFSSQC